MKSLIPITWGNVRAISDHGWRTFHGELYVDVLGAFLVLGASLCFMVSVNVSMMGNGLLGAWGFERIIDILFAGSAAGFAVHRRDFPR